MKKLLALSLLVMAGPAAADNRDTAVAFMECARISNDARRLACYDRLATDLIELGLAGATSAAPPPAAPAPTRTTMAAQSPDPVPAPAPAVPSPPVEASAAAVPSAPPPAPAPAAPAPAAEAPATAAAPAPPPAPVASASPPSSRSEAEFGYERTADGKSKELKEIRSRHVPGFTGWTGKTVFRLENGQVWQQTRSGRMAYRGPDRPMITIKRGFMGGYQLTVEGINKKVYVKRIE
jgi:hypothetical protein